MNTTIKTAFAVAALFLLGDRPHVRAEEPPKAAQVSNEELGRLQGTWEGAEVGREADGKCTLTISGDSIQFQGSNKADWYKGTFSLPPRRNPKELLAIITDCQGTDYIGMILCGIYKLEEGTLTLVDHKPGEVDPPEGFEGDTTTRRFVFKNVQAPKGPAAGPVRQRFVPGPPDAPKGNGASFSALHHLDTDLPGVLMVTAYAGIGDSFPVQEEHGAKHFDVTVAGGDDDHLKLEIRAADGTKQEIDVKRDGVTPVILAGRRFTLAYPSVTVGPESPSTADKALVIVNRFP